MSPVQALESEWPPFSFFSLTAYVNSQTKTSKVREDKLGGGDHFSAAKYKGRIVDWFAYVLAACFQLEGGNSVASYCSPFFCNAT
jgi:hypothetical protein